MGLKSKFSKKESKFKANKIFTDRIEPRAVFANGIEKITLAQDEEHSRQITVFYGKGGIGKTSLLKQIMDTGESAVYAKYPQYRYQNISISMEAYDYANPINILTAIRGQLSGDGSLFDYALMQYYAKARISIEEIKTKNDRLPPLIIDMLNEAIELCTASACIPKNLLEKGIEFIKDRRFQAKYKEDIRQIAALDEFEIFDRLPYYLGLCINHSAENGVIHVLFLDSYESIKRRTEGMVSSVDSAEWLKELFLNCERTLFVIGSRDRLDWEKQDEDWGIYLDQHLLSNLSDEDCRWFLQQVPIADTGNDTVENIIRHAGGVPLYLDLCVDIYEDAVNNGATVDFSNFNGSSAIIDRYMRHLKEKDQYAVSVLATLESFDCDFAIKMLEKQNLVYHIGELYALLEKSVFVALEGKGELWKVDESVRSHIYEQMLPKWRIALLQNLTEVILENRSGRMYPYFSMTLGTAIKYPEYIEPIKEALFDELEYFASIGYWNELRMTLSPYLLCENSGLKALAVFSELIWLRRTGNLTEADKFAKDHPLRKEDMGVWHYVYRFLQVHIQHLLGKYDQSLLRYKELIDEMDLVKSIIPAHIYNTIAIKYADLLFLKGRFQESLALAEQLLAQTGTPLPDVIELLRIKGHIFRFQKQYPEAILIYDSALKLVLNHGLRALEGKLYTNLAEANCTTNPDAALMWYEKAMEINIRMNNEIEVGKAQAAAAVAMTAAGNCAQGERLARTSAVTAEMTGYRSGKVFALLALAYAQKQAGKPEEMTATVAQAKELVSEIGVYHYLVQSVGE